MIGKKCKVKSEYNSGRHKKSKGREGMIMGESRDKKSWSILWDGNKNGRDKWNKNFIQIIN